MEKNGDALIINFGVPNEVMIGWFNLRAPPSKQEREHAWGSLDINIVKYMSFHEGGLVMEITCDNCNGSAWCLSLGTLLLNLCYTTFIGIIQPSK